MNLSDALKLAQQAFQKHPHWRMLDGTPWANDAAVVAAQLMVDALDAEINTPETRDFVTAVMREAAHQRERWGEREGYTELEWAGVATWLVGKAGVTMFQTGGDREKYLHRIITVAAVAANWHRNALAAVKAPTQDPA